MSKIPARKSIISNFSALSNALSSEGSHEPEAADVAAVAPQQVARVGAGVIGATQRTLTEIREERDRLRALLEAGGAVEIDPALIDPSPYPDRLPDDSDLEFQAFKRLISEEGQKIPIEVRRHPENNGRYQVVYGHRRWRAAYDLGIPVKAIVVNFTDRELVIAQGIENSARQDLSWIEKAIFAWRMEGAGIKARDIRAALSIDDPELAHYRAVCRLVTLDVIEMIGRAPKIGRPRWVELAKALSSDPDGLDRLRKTLAAAKVSSSDQKFREALNAICKAPKRSRADVDLRTPSGKIVGRASFGGNEIRLTMEKSRSDAFVAFFQNEIPVLMERFFEAEGER